MSSDEEHPMIAELRRKAVEDRAALANFTRQKNRVRVRDITRFALLFKTPPEVTNMEYSREVRRLAHIWWSNFDPYEPVTIVTDDGIHALAELPRALMPIKAYENASLDDALIRNRMAQMDIGAAYLHPKDVAIKEAFYQIQQRRIDAAGSAEDVAKMRDEYKSQVNLLIDLGIVSAPEGSHEENGEEITGGDATFD